MFNISTFLKKTIDAVDSQELKKKEIQFIIQKHTGYLCDLEKIDIKKDTLIISLNPGYKMALFMKKEEILKELLPLGISDMR